MVKGKSQYKFPKNIATMTVHHLYGMSDVGQQKSVVDYLSQNQGFALAADLIAQGFKPEDVAEAVNSGDVAYAHWPAEEPKTDLFYLKDEKTIKSLDDLADKVVKLCGGGEDQPIGGDFASAGAEMGNQQIAIVALIYAREKEKLKEIPKLDRGAGPMYVVKGSFSDKMLSALLK